MALPIIIGTLQNRAAPFTDQALGQTLDAWLWLLAQGVEVYQLANSAAQQDILVDGQLGKGIEEVALNAVGGEAAITEWLEEELDRLNKVGIRVENGVLNRRAIEESGDLREEFELVCGGQALLTGLVVCATSVLHRKLEIGDLLVDFVFQILGKVSRHMPIGAAVENTDNLVLLAPALRLILQSLIHGPRNGSPPPLLRSQVLFIHFLLLLLV